MAIQQRRSIPHIRRPGRRGVRPPLLLLVLSLLVALHTASLWWVIPSWRRINTGTDADVVTVVAYQPSPQTECAAWTPTNTTTTSSIGLTFREHIRTSLHQGHFHFFHFLEFVVVAWVELRTQHAVTATPPVAWIHVPHMTHAQAFGNDNDSSMHRLLLRLVFGPAVQLYGSDDVSPPATTTTTLSIERSRCTDPTIKKLWWRHWQGFASREWYSTIKRNAAAVVESKPEQQQHLRKPIRIAYLDRQSTRRRFPPLLHRWLLRYLGQYVPQSSNIPIEFTHLRMEYLLATEQFQAASDIDILISMHGNGLSHQFFMAPGGAVVEVFWEFPFAFDYATAALMFMDHAYLGVWNGQVLDEGRIRRLDPTLRTEYAAGRLYAWYETEWTSRRVADRVEATKAAIQAFVMQQIDRIERERETLLSSD